MNLYIVALVSAVVGLFAGYFLKSKVAPAAAAEVVSVAAKVAADATKVAAEAKKA